MDEKLRKVASESTSKIPSATTSKSNKHKPSLAQLISKSSQETKLRTEAAAESLFEAEEGEEAELESATPSSAQKPQQQKINVGRGNENRGSFRGREATEAEADNFQINLLVRMTLMT